MSIDDSGVNLVDEDGNGEEMFLEWIFLSGWCLRSRE